MLSGGVPFNDLVEVDRAYVAHVYEHRPSIDLLQRMSSFLLSPSFPPY